MIYVYTKEPKDDPDYVRVNDVFFSMDVLPQGLPVNAEKIMLQIDHAKIIDSNRIETPYGIGDLRDLSTGCKTVINIMSNPDRIINASECGENALTEIFKLEKARIYLNTARCFEISANTEVQIDDAASIKWFESFDDLVMATGRWW